MDKHLRSAAASFSIREGQFVYLYPETSLQVIFYFSGRFLSSLNYEQCPELFKQKSHAFRLDLNEILLRTYQYSWDYPQRKSPMPKTFQKRRTNPLCYYQIFLNGNSISEILIYLYGIVKLLVILLSSMRKTYSRCNYNMTVWINNNLDI